MALLGVSLILASFVLICMRRPAWFTSIFGVSSQPQIAPSTREPPGPERSGRRSDYTVTRHESSNDPKRADGETLPNRPQAAIQVPTPPPPSLVVQQEAAFDTGLGSPDTDSADDGPTTPKASAAIVDSTVPTLALSAPESTLDALRPNGSASAQAPAHQPASTLMPPPPRPPTLRPPPSASSSAAATAPSSLAPPLTRNLPLPPRGPGCSTLAPPPTHSSKPAKPSRQVVLTPGHSPLDWARLSGHPAADLRGLPPGSPYLRVTPGMLKKQTGRKGKDAWTVLGGRVYNITPYLPFHPGGEPELLKGAGREGTRLFGEIHPWVNYEGMLAACLVGIYVPEEEEGGGGAAGNGAAAGGDMEAMD